MARDTACTFVCRFKQDQVVNLVLKLKRGGSLREVWVLQSCTSVPLPRKNCMCQGALTCTYNIIVVHSLLSYIT